MPRTTRVLIPKDSATAILKIESRELKLTHLDKIFWPKKGFLKRDLLQYYADISPFLLPHIRRRAMVMKRYPEGAGGFFFFMKRAPSPRPKWIETCTIEHKNAGPVPYPLVNDLSSLLWMINLGCIDLNPWYAECGDFNRPDYLHFDLDPGPGASFARVCATALSLQIFLKSLRIPAFAKTTGSRGIHVYVPILPNLLQKEVWRVAKWIAFELASQEPKTITAQYRKEKRPFGRVLIDYNQNAWGRTLASVYSVRPTEVASVSAPVTWEEVASGKLKIEDFRMENMIERVKKVGDLWKPLLSRKRFDLQKFMRSEEKEIRKIA